MQRNCYFRVGILNPRVVAAVILCSAGAAMGMFGVATPSAKVAKQNTNASPPSSRPASPTTITNPTRPSFDSSSIKIDPLSRQSTARPPVSPSTPGGIPHWSIVSSPNAGYSPTSLSATTCVTASDCWATGRTEIGQTFANTALLHWDGNSWSVVPSPSIAQQTNGLVDITCLSSSSCWAVGYIINIRTVQVQTLALHWDGTSWLIVPTPNVGNGFNALYGVACTSDSNCWAVGFSNQSSAAQTLIEKWDGQSWKVQNSPNVGTSNNVLNAVICLSASDCRAVGYRGMAGAKNSLIAQWDGTAWTASTLPNQPLAEENTLTSIVCNTSTDCWAVGNTYNGTVHQTLIEQWNGTTWSNALAPNTGVDNYLTRVTCASTSDCWAVGNSTNSAVDPQAFDQDLVLHWNGTAWLPNTDLVNLTSTYASDLVGVTCAIGTECWAVGFLQPSGSGRPQIAQWNGNSWALVTAPDVPALPSNFLDDVTCVSHADCWAVGFNFYGNVARSETMHWDGSSWNIVASPNTALDRNNYLGHVTCLTTSDCWAVGNSSDDIGTETQALSMHWDGNTWSNITVSPIDTSQSAETVFEGVACNSTSDCWAVGFSLIQDYAGLIEHWNGTGWALVSTPPLSDPTARSIFYDVTCTGVSDCTAVGVQWTTALTGSGLYQTLVAHYDGTSWSVVSSPNTATDQDNILSAVTCAAANDCWAVGSDNNYSQALIEHWDGASWSMVNAPQIGSILNAVTCVSTSDCWAAGPYYTPNPPAHTFLAHWDGNAWSQVSSPNTNQADSDYLAGITCVSSADCWAVGQYWRKSVPQTLTLHLAVGPPVPTSVVSRKIHGSAGTFDVDLPLTDNPGIECRSGGVSGEYTIVFSFPNALTSVDGASVSSGTGTVGSSGIDSDPHQYVVNLSGVSNAQTIVVSLGNVADSAGNFGSVVSVSMGVLIGDTTGNGVVNSSDIAQTQSQSGQPVTSFNFREDVTVNGAINSSDIVLVQSKSGTSVP
jgi:hypothetical protein